MPYAPQNYDHLLGTPGFSDQLLKNHFTLYQGYVTNTNKLSDLFDAMLKEGKTGTPEFAELKRRLGWEFNGMRLHEYYFGNMSKEVAAPNTKSALHKKIVAAFGSFEQWEVDFKAVGSMRGIGWAILYYDTQAERLFNVWINEHDVGHFAGCTPVLIMDVFEHAFMLDYGTKRADYITAFMKAINWPVVEGRLA
jgi:Fe-Mn family superoxide dismutase